MEEIKELENQIETIKSIVGDIYDYRVSEIGYQDDDDSILIKCEEILELIGE